MHYVTYEELIAILVLIVSIIELIISIYNHKKK